MALGTLGSTLNDELNRLANGGTYRDMNQMVDEALAAKQWANRENINPYSTDTVGILNEIAGLGLDKRNWLDFNGVCNYIAGTTGLPAAAALRQVYPTTDLLTGVASYYVDAAYPTGLTNTPGYVYLNATAGNFMSTPDANALDITGDIDIRVQVALDNWTPSALQALVTKWTNPSPNLSYYFGVESNGRLSLYWTTNGGTVINRTSTVATGITNGAIKWVRVVLDVNNGASGHDVLFYTSDDGTTWTQLGTTVTTAGTTSVWSGGAILVVGAADAGASQPAAGKFYRAQVRNGIDGTVVFDANMANVSLTATSFTESSSNAATVTINGFRAYPQTADNLGAAGSLLPTTLGSSTAADSNDPKFLDFTGTNYVYTPGVTNNNLSVPDSNDLDITGDIDLRFYAALDDWSPTDLFFAGKFGSAGNYSWDWYGKADGTMVFEWSTNGTALINKRSTAAVPFSDGSPGWVRVTLDVDNGASGNDVKFWTSTNGTTWTQLGSTVTTAGTTNIFASTASVVIGGYNATAGNTLPAKIYKFQVYNGIDGTKVLDVDTSVITAGSATSFTAVTGQTVTINRSTSGRKTVAVTQPTWLFGTDDYMEVNNRYMSSGTYLYLPGVNGNYCSVPDSAALSVTGDIDLRVKAALDDWTPSPLNSILLGKYSGGNRSYVLSVDADGKLRLRWSTDGSTLQTQTSSASNTIADGTTAWVRVTRVASTGVIKFFTSTDGTNWTQLGTDISGATGNIFDGAGGLEIGSQDGGSSNNNARGKIFRAQVLDGIDGTVAFDANFETSITSLNQASFTESSANAATVTINRSGSTYRSAGITTAGYLYPGATNTFTASATDFLNFGASDSFTAVAVVRQFATVSQFDGFLSKRLTTANGGNGYEVTASSSSNGSRIGTDDGPNSLAAELTQTTVGSLVTATGVVNRATNTSLAYVNANVSAATSISTLGSLSNIETLRFGIRQVTGAYANMELYAGAVFRQVLTAAQIRQISNYFANREVYL